MAETPVPEMIERVAGALWHSDCPSGDPPWPEWVAYAQKWKHHQPSVDLYRRRARDAIEVMREPNLAMRKVCSFEAAEVTWPAMIDAALAPTQAEGER